MATHNWVVRKLAKYHMDIGDDIFADHCLGYRRPPTFYGPKGAPYKPDIWVENQQLAYEVEPYNAAKHSLPQLKAFAKDPGIKRFIVVICSGTERGIDRMGQMLVNRGILNGLEGEIDLHSWRELFDHLGIERP